MLKKVYKLIKLKDVNIDEIRDDLVNYSVFQGTFSPDGSSELTDMELQLSDGRTILLASYEVSYSDPVGFGAIGTMVLDMLRLVTTVTGTTMVRVREIVRATIVESN